MNQSQKKLLKFACYAGCVLLAGFVLFLAILIYLGVSARGKPEPQTWHRSPRWEDNLTQQKYGDFAEYLAKEKEYLDKIYAEVRIEKTAFYNKYAEDNLSSPYVNGNNLNASFEFLPKDEVIRGGILLVHGLTDSPYHLRSIGQLFADNGFYVISLRLPGHGTVPGALLNVSWKDWYAAVQFGAEKLMAKIENSKDYKFYVGGFSTGGALTLRYVLDAVSGQYPKVPDKLLLLSPAIAIDPFAEMIDWHKLISWMSYFEKFRWLDIKPEYDPFKYNSFAKNAADQIFDLTEANWDLIEGIAKDEERRKKLPPFYAFQSRVDATVKTDKLMEMFAKIASDKSELLIFDVNHLFEMAMSDELHTDFLESQLNKNIKARVMVVSNGIDGGGAGYEKSVSIETLHQAEGNISYLAQQKALLQNLEWPDNVFALSHVCIPISPEDPYYGRESVLGKINAKGEHKVLLLGDDLTRLRYNPFFALLKMQLEHGFLESNKAEK